MGNMSRPSETLYATAYGSQRVKPIEVLLGEKRRVYVDWNGYLAHRETTISSSSWASEGRLVAPGSTSSSNGITSALLTPGTGTGVDSIKASVTLSNGEQLVRKFRAYVIDPLNITSGGGSYMTSLKTKSDEFTSLDYTLTLTETPDDQIFGVYFDGIYQSADNYELSGRLLTIDDSVDLDLIERITAFYSYT